MPKPLPQLSPLTLDRGSHQLTGPIRSDADAIGGRCIRERSNLRTGSDWGHTHSDGGSALTHQDRDIVTRRRFLTTTGFLLLAPALHGCGSERPAEWPTRSHAPPAVDDLPPRVIGLRSLGGAFRFDPVGLLIEPDTEVIWLNMGDFHTTTAFHPDNVDLLPTGVPLRIAPGAVSWHSGMIGLTASTQFTHRFTAKGVYDYFCQPHYGFGMVGRIVVGEPVGGLELAKRLTTSSRSGARRGVLLAQGRPRRSRRRSL